jgi:GNAT superfamily N-acetyltransferase
MSNIFAPDPAPGQSGPFHCEAWLSASAAATGGQLLHPADELPLAGPLLVRRIGPYRVGGSPLPKSGTPITAGLRGSAYDNTAQLTALGRWFRGSGLSLLQVTSPTRPGDCGASRVEQIQNLEIDLEQDCQVLWDRLSPLPRRMVRKAVRTGIRVSWVDPSGPHLDAHLRLARDIFKAHGEAPVYRPQHYQAIQQAPLKQHVRMFMASQHGKPLGYLVSVRDGDRAYYWDVAVDSGGRADGAGHLLLWTWMRWCKRKGIRRLDLIGPPEGGRAGRRAGIGRFKLSFGAIATDYWVVYWHRHGAGLALDVSRWLARRRGNASATSTEQVAGPVGDD